MTGGGAAPKALLVVPMTGAGTWEDPKRPAIVGESGAPFRYQVSDDGTMALVEASPRTIAEAETLTELTGKESRAKLFRPEKDRAADVATEFRKWKKDFDPTMFTGFPGAGKKPVAAEPVR